MTGTPQESPASAFPPAPVYLLEQEMEGCALLPFAGGRVAVYSHRSPAKTTPNEDAVALIALGLDAGIIAVADGVGGLRSGEIASRTTLEAIASAVCQAPRENGSLRTAILDGIESANRAVMALESGGGSTLALIEVQGRRVRPYHVGDSVILVTGQRGLLKLQTVPHSPTGYAVESGMIDEWEAMVHEDRHLIDNMVGTDRMRIEIGHSIELAEHDTVLLASDGLSDNLHPAEIVDLVRKGPLDRAAAALMSACRSRMDKPREDHPSKLDDLSFVVFRIR